MPLLSCPLERDHGKRNSIWGHMGCRRYSLQPTVIKLSTVGDQKRVFSQKKDVKEHTYITAHEASRYQAQALGVAAFHERYDIYVLAAKRVASSRTAA